MQGQVYVLEKCQAFLEYIITMYIAYMSKAVKHVLYVTPKGGTCQALEDTLPANYTDK